MAHYYTLGTAVPQLRLEDNKLEQNTKEFVEELKSKATARDKQLIDLVLLEGDNRLLITLIKEKPDPVIFMPFALGKEKLEHALKFYRGDEDVPEPKDLPAYMKTFLRNFFDGKYEQKEDKGAPIFFEDKLAELYYDYAFAKSNSFLKEWFRMNLDITNILTAITAKKFDLRRDDYLLGHDQLTEIMSSGVWTDVTHLPNADLLSQIIKIGEEGGLLEKERKIDALKWQFLEEKTFADAFSIDAMIAHLLKLQILERWTVLDREKGRETLTTLIDDLKTEGRDDLREFVEKNKKK